MPWFKVDDGFAFHRKAIKAGNTALGLWVRAGSWCAHQLTDGQVPSEILPLLGGTTDDAEQLVAAGFWEAVEGGYQFYGWHDYQPTKADVEEERAKARERQKAWRKTKRHAVSNAVTDGVTSPVTDVVTDSVSHGGSNGAPSLPVPSLPVPISSARKRATQLPKEWKPNESHLEIAVEYGLDPAFQLRAFRDHHEAKGTTYKSWDAAFRNWLNKAHSFSQPAYSAPTPVARKHLPESVPDDLDPDDIEGYAAYMRGERL